METILEWTKFQKHCTYPFVLKREVKDTDFHSSPSKDLFLEVCIMHTITLQAWVRGLPAKNPGRLQTLKKERNKLDQVELKNVNFKNMRNNCALQAQVKDLTGVFSKKRLAGLASKEYQLSYDFWSKAKLGSIISKILHQTFELKLIISNPSPKSGGVVTM